MDCCSPHEAKPKSENVRAIERNVSEFLWKVRECDGIETQEKFTMALFTKLATAKTIEELANITIDMQAALQKIKLKKENEEEDTEKKLGDEVFIELFKIDVKETTDDSKEDME